ncbi:MAG: DUF58 domain-containing protein [Planctomycetales bacterium]|nr:DUF58 domain-containing protein [Planctomycetales bacterium]
MSSLPLLSPADRESLLRLQILARKVVESVHTGMHRSPHKGTSAEFREHRPYVRGDEIRSLDWNLYGKTDRLYVRQYEDETNLRAIILVDQSGSMKYSGTRSQITKHQYAVRLAACLATLLISQQDSVGLALYDAQLREFMAARSHPSHLSTLCAALVKSQPAGNSQLHNVVHQLTPRMPKRGLVFLVSDLFEDSPQLLSSLQHLRRRQCEVVVFQVWDPDELDFPFRRLTQFQSLESANEAHVLDPIAVRRAYLERLAEFRSRLAETFAAEGIDCLECISDQPQAEILANYLVRRGNPGKRRMRGTAR